MSDQIEMFKEKARILLAHGTERPIKAARVVASFTEDGDLSVTIDMGCTYERRLEDVTVVLSLKQIQKLFLGVRVGSKTTLEVIDFVTICDGNDIGKLDGHLDVEHHVLLKVG
jgi:hypothetical protein